MVLYFQLLINFGQKLPRYNELNFGHNEPTELNEAHLKADYTPFPFTGLTGLLLEEKTVNIKQT
jgi:hypothetical protein